MAENNQIQEELSVKLAYERPFPIFINPKNYTVLIVGVGTIGTRRLKTLSKFDFDVRVISRSFTDEAREIISEKGYKVMEEDFKAVQGRIKLRAFDMVIAATSDRDVNRFIGEECRRYSIPVSVADAREECTFFFPATVFHENITIGICGDGSNHKKTSALAKTIRGEFEK